MDRLDVKRTQIADALQWCGGCSGQYRLRVGDVMTPAPVCIASSTSVLDIVRMIHAKQFRHLLVTDHRGRLLGLVSDRDVLRCFGPGRYPDQEILAGIAAAEIMSSDLVTIRPETRLLHAATEMLAHGISCLPVLADDKIVGILTSSDLSAVLEVVLQTSDTAQPESSADSPSGPADAAVHAAARPAAIQPVAAQPSAAR
jgi:CBS domain-containing protein